MTESGALLILRLCRDAIRNAGFGGRVEYVYSSVDIRELEYQGAWEPNTSYLKNDVVLYPPNVRGFNRTWKDEWSGTTGYVPNDVVYVDEDLWLSTQVGSGSGPSDPSDHWTRLRERVDWRRTWSATEEYNRNDMVTYKNRGWVATKAGRRNRPGGNTGYWTPYGFAFGEEDHRFRGEWDHLRSYDTGEVVAYGEELYETAGQVPAGKPSFPGSTAAGGMRPWRDLGWARWIATRNVVVGVPPQGEHPRDGVSWVPYRWDPDGDGPAGADGYVYRGGWARPGKNAPEEYYYENDVVDYDGRRYVARVEREPNGLKVWTRPVDDERYPEGEEVRHQGLSYQANRSTMDEPGMGSDWSLIDTDTHRRILDRDAEPGEDSEWCRCVNVIVTLSSEDQYQTVRSYSSAGAYTVDIRSVVYEDIDRVDAELRSLVISNPRGGEVRAGFDFAEDSSEREAVFRRQRQVVIFPP